jgi:hypothetical protein
MKTLLPQYLYELGRGVRQLFLLTMTPREAEAVLARLNREGIAYYLQPVNDLKVNLYFGNPQFVAVARWIAIRPLSQLSAEEDFMLGTLLGYDREQQCRRYLGRIDIGLPALVAMAARA